MTPIARTEDSPTYNPQRTADDSVIANALRILAGRLAQTGPAFSNPQTAKDYCRLNLGGLEHEAFGCLFLDSQHLLIEFKVMFTGTLCQTSVYPREVVKAALAVNAGAVILTHNHPSGSTEPSRADEHLTQSLKSALALVDVRVIDHMVVSASGASSFAERGLL